MPDGECPTGAANTEAINNLKGWVQNMDERVRDVEKAVAKMPLILITLGLTFATCVATLITLFAK